MKGFLKYFRKLDIIGPGIGLELENDTKYKSNFGAASSIVMMILAIVICILFGQEIYERKRPNLSDSEISRENLQISIKDLDINIAFLTIKNNDPLELDILEYFDITPKLFGYTFDGNYINNYNFSLTSCQKNTAYSSYCLNSLDDSADYIYNDPLTLNSTILGFSVDKCNSKIRKCPDDLDDILESTNFFNFNFKTNIINKANYSNPISTIERGETVSLSNNLYTAVEMNFQKNLFVTDNGWILENIKNYDFVYYHGIKIKYNLISKEASQKMWFTLGMSRYENKTMRSYMKVQDLFAKIGGIINAILIFSNILLQHFIQFQYRNDIFNLIYSENINEQLQKKEIKWQKEKKNEEDNCNAHDKSIIPFKNNNLQITILPINKNNDLKEGGIKFLKNNSSYENDNNFQNNMDKSKNASRLNIENKVNKDKEENEASKVSKIIKKESLSGDQLTELSVPDFSKSPPVNYLSFLLSYVCCNSDIRRTNNFIIKYYSLTFSVNTYGKLIMDYLEKNGFIKKNDDK